MGTKTAVNQFDDDDDDDVLPPLQTVKEFDDGIENDDPIPNEDENICKLEEIKNLSSHISSENHAKPEVTCLLKDEVVNNVMEEKHAFHRSFMIQSLLNIFCKLLENVSAKQKTLDQGICRALNEKILIDERCEVDELGDIKNQYLQSLWHLFKVADDSEVRRELINLFRRNQNNQLLAKSIICPHPFVWSRYQRDFHEKGFIARGGFGYVYRAKNKLDGIEYAVKKIRLRFNKADDIRKSLQEVKLLAQMHHPNIVDYKAAWLEPLDTILKPSYDNSITDDSLSSSMYHKSESLSSSYLTSSVQISNEVSEHGKWNSYRTESTASTEENVLCIFGQPDEKLENRVEHLQLTEVDCATLYIQMKLYDKTLQQWLTYRNENKIPVDIKQCLIGFQKLVSGIVYIHTQGVIHHDIKPSNIFANSDLTEVLVGDFGLSCLLQHSHQDLTVLSQTYVHGDHKNMEIGTKLYGAPEQLKGVCNMKSDIYSLGIVLFELLQPFNTIMEKSIYMEELKAGEVPAELIAVAPELVKMIKRMISPSMEIRPTAKQLFNELQCLLYHLDDISPTNETIGLLLTQINQRDEEIEKLKNEKFQSIKEIKDLKLKLQRYEALDASVA